MQLEQASVDEQNLKIYCSHKQTNDIRGKIYKPDGSLLYPRILL
jgi:hypothetical protein